MKQKVNLQALKGAAAAQIKNLTEVVQRDKLRSFLSAKVAAAPASPKISQVQSLIPKDHAHSLLTASLATFLLHVEGRIAAFVGQGFYTIGPCGEENLACLGLLANEKDAFSLHYRHLAATIGRQLQQKNAIESVLLDRARGYTVSQQDKVTGGRHCAQGGGAYDFYVTSTLASQAPTAVARGLGFSLAQQTLKTVAPMLSLSTEGTVTDFQAEKLQGLGKFEKDAVSVVSVGDGSVNNNLFLSALNFADYASFRGFKCPTLFVISDNDICISLRNYQYLQHFLTHKVSEETFLKAKYCDGMDINDVYAKTKEALADVRAERKPGILVIRNLPRRFGHAATDRQSAYLTNDEISRAADRNPIERTVDMLLEANLTTAEAVLEEFTFLEAKVQEAFEVAANEEKTTTREDARRNTFAPLLPKQELVSAYPALNPADQLALAGAKRKKIHTMRENMNQVYHELLQLFPQTVYVGEDVRHGGYYLVTEGLHDKYGHRVQDIPPDETMLTALGMGYSQCGMLPIVEFPYSKCTANCLLTFRCFLYHRLFFHSVLCRSRLWSRHVLRKYLDALVHEWGPAEWNATSVARFRSWCVWR